MTAPNFSQPAIFSEVSTPTAPDSGYLKVYAKSGALYSIANGASEKAYATSTDLSSYLPLAGGTLTGDLKFTDATYDIGKSGATRPRDGFFSRNFSAGGTITAGGDIITQQFGRILFPGAVHHYSIGSNYPEVITFSRNGAAFAQMLYGTTQSGAYTSGLQLDVQACLSWLGSGGVYPSNSPDLIITRDAAGVLAQRNSTNAQTFRIYNIYTSSTSFENLQIKANAGAAYQIGSAIGSAGGSNRDIDIGTYNSGGTFTTTLRVKTTSGIEVGGSGGGSNFINVRGEASSWGEYGIGYWNASDATILYGYSGRNVSIGHLVFGKGTYSPKLAFDGNGSATFTPAAATSGSVTSFTYTDPAHTGQTASTEATSVNFNLSSTKQFANGAITTQRAFRIQAPVYSHVSGSNTITTASTVAISGAPTTTGGFTTITNAYALNVESGISNFGGNLRVSSGGLSVLGGELYIHQGIFIQDAVINFNGSRIRSGAGWGAMGDFSLSFENNSSTQIFRVDTGNYIQCSNNAHLRFSSNSSNGDLCLYRDAANILAQRNSTNAQTFRLYGTHTSSTSYELLEIRGVSGANFEIGPENGSAGGTLRGLTLGGYTAGSGTITPWLTFDNTGIATFNTGNLTLTSNGTGLTIQNGHLWMDSWGVHSGLRSRRANGTIGSPTQILNGNLMSFYSAIGWHSGGAYHSTHAGFIGFYATENYTPTAQGCRMVLATTPNGTTTNTTALEISQSGVCMFSKLVGQASAEITSTPSGTTQTITLNNGNHQTLTLTSSTGNVTATLTVPSNVSSGTLIVKQHASTPRSITWAVSSGTIRWMGTQPTWASDAANAVRIVSWRWDGSVMYLMSTDVAA